MPRRRRPASCLLLLLLAGPAFGQAPGSDMTVKVAEAEVRSGPSEAFYVTNKLRKGDIVRIVRPAENGWLGIAPPSGSFSWIATQYLRPVAQVPNPNTWMVEVPGGGRASVLVGSRHLESKPNRVGAQLVTGTLVTGIGPPRPDADGTWLPIMPPAAEVRYLRQEAVEAGPTTAAPAPMTTATARPGLPPVGAAAPTASPSPPPTSVSATPPPPAPAPAPAGVDPLFKEAQDHEQAGRLDQAIALYDALGRKYAATDHARAMQFHFHAHTLRQRLAGPVPLTDNRLRPVPAGTPTPPSPVCPPVAATPPRPPSEARPAVTPPPASGTASVQSSGPGRLRASQRLIDGRRSFYLVSGQEQVVMWVTEQAGTNLEPYVDRNVELLGYVQPRGDVRPRYMIVARAIPLP